MDIPVLFEHNHEEVVGALRQDGTMEFENGIQKDWLPAGIQFAVLEKHEENGVTYFDRIRVVSFSVSPKAAS